MIEILKESKGSLLGVKISGKLTDDDYHKVLIPKFKEIMENYGHSRFLVELAPDFEGFDLMAIWHDLKLGLIDEGYHIEKMAVVGGPELFLWGIKFSVHFMQGEIRTFEAGKLDQAWTWIKEPLPDKPLKQQPKESPAMIDI